MKPQAGPNTNVENKMPEKQEKNKLRSEMAAENIKIVLLHEHTVRLDHKTNQKDSISTIICFVSLEDSTVSRLGHTI